MADLRETIYEYVQGEQTGTFYSAETKWINRIHKWKKQYPDQVDIRATNEDGSLVVHLPAKWFKLSPTKKMSEEHKQAMADGRNNKNE